MITNSDERLIRGQPPRLRQHHEGSALPLAETARKLTHPYLSAEPLAVVPGATHLFTEPGTLATAAGLARDWFTSHLDTGP